MLLEVGPGEPIDAAGVMALGGMLWEVLPATYWSKKPGSIQRSVTCWDIRSSLHGNGECLEKEA